MNRFREILQAVQVIDRTQQNLRRLAVLRKGLGEGQGRTNDFLLHRHLFCSGTLGQIIFQVLAIGEHCGVTGLTGILVCGILVGGALIFLRRTHEVAVFQHQASELVIDFRRLGFIRKGFQVATVPMNGLGVVLRLVILQLLVLVRRMIVAGQVDQVGLLEFDHAGVVLDIEYRPVLGIQCVGIGKGLFRFQHQFRETTLLVNLDDADGEVRCNLVQRVALNERGVRLGGVLIATLVQVVFAQMAVNVGLVIPRSLAIEIIHNGLGTTEIGEAQADDTEGVFNMLAVGLVGRLFEVVAFGNLVIEHAHVVIERHLVHFLLEQGPAALVQRNLIEAGGNTHINDARIGLFRVQVLLAGKVVFTQPEIGFVHMTGGREPGNQLPQHVYRLVDLSGLFIGPGQLIHHLVIAIIHGVLIEQFPVQRNSLAGIGREESIGVIARQGTGKVSGRRGIAGNVHRCGSARLKVRLAFTAAARDAIQRDRALLTI